jgi:hypothetical protein
LRKAIIRQARKEDLSVLQRRRNISTDDHILLKGWWFTLNCEDKQNKS